MPISRSKSQRKAARQKQQHVKQQVVELRRGYEKTLTAALMEHDKAAYLARLLCYIVASQGGSVVIPAAQLRKFPERSYLQELFDREQDQFVLTSVVVEDDTVPVDAPAPQIEVVTPKIEVVSR